MELSSGVFAIALASAGAIGVTAQGGFSRVVLQDQALSVAGRHAVTARAEFGPGANAGRHAHPGEEIGYILEGTVELSVEGHPTVTLKPGDVFFIPSGVPHDGRNPGAAKAALLSTFVAEPGKPLTSPVPKSN
jgi:quercetin dioxygenase-like cupin family protein